jgi:integrase
MPRGFCPRSRRTSHEATGSIRSLGGSPLGEYTAQWIDERDLSVRSAELYRGLLRNHITPWIGHLDLADVVPPTIRRWRRKLRDHSVSEGVMAKAYRLLHAVLTTAVEDGSIRANPCTIKGAGQHESDERPVATLEQVFALAEAIQPRYRLVVLLATFTSLRYGEIMGLRRGDFALGDRKVKIDRTHIQPDTGPTFDGDPKANSGRTVSLPMLLVPEVEAHLTEFVDRSPDASVFVGPRVLARRAATSTPSGTGRASGSASLSYICTTYDTPATPSR